jgi:signal transduction histidine kinase
MEEGEMKYINLNTLIEGVLVLLSNRFKGKIDLINNLDSHLPLIECNPGKMNYVFMHILSNAFDAIDVAKKSGSITITTRIAGNECVISIKDNGIGMSENTLSKIFDPFFTTKEVGKGTGLGLSVTYGIIQEHKGKIEVFSTLGEGSEFVIVVPVSR